MNTLFHSNWRFRVSFFVAQGYCLCRHIKQEVSWVQSQVVFRVFQQFLIYSMPWSILSTFTLFETTLFLIFQPSRYPTMFRCLFRFYSAQLGSHHCCGVEKLHNFLLNCLHFYTCYFNLFMKGVSLVYKEAYEIEKPLGFHLLCSERTVDMEHF